MTTYRKKLIEVDIPLDAINRIAAKEKRGSRPGHPSTLHRYWARRPLAACRAVIFASMVDDPSECAEFTTDSAQEAERNRLHKLIQQLAMWENSNDENLLTKARCEIAISVVRNNGEDPIVCRDQFERDPDAVLQYLHKHCPAVYDPFCGGGSIPLEAQRLGLRARGSDLNPLPVLLTKSMIELPPQFHNKKPVNPDADPMGMFMGPDRRRTLVPWKGTAGLADDIRYYGAWMREEAHKRIGHLYPKMQLPTGQTSNVVAWLWARTIPCINPACNIQMPLMGTFQLSIKQRNQHWTKPIVDRETNTISFIVQAHDNGVPRRGTVNRTGAYCIACGSSVKLPYVREQAKAGKMREIMTAIVTEGERKKLFLSPANAHIQVAQSVKSAFRPRGRLPERALGFAVQNYGFTEWNQLFTERQLIVLDTFSTLLVEVRNHILQDGGETEYADAVCTYLSLAIGRTTDSGCSFARWHTGELIAQIFARQAIGIMWDFAEANPFSNSTQNWMNQVEWVAKAIENLPCPTNSGQVYQADASTTIHAKDGPVIVTDPPYYDNIGYADLSDFFYVWLRPLLRDTYPELFGGISTPKNEEITASPRFENPTRHFEELLGKAFLQMRQHCSSTFPTSIFYAYKQQEEEREGRSSTGWETMLMATINAGFQIVATWPMRTESTARPRAIEANALASSVILVCRPRPEDAPPITRPEFLQELKKELPPALDRLTRIANIRPVDLAQAAIGPGMEIYSRYSKVMRISGEIVPIREVLKEINKEITAYHEKETGELDSESQFCLTWLKQHGYMEGNFGDAQVLATAKSVDIDSIHDKVLLKDRSKVRLLKIEEYAERENNENMTAWEGCLRMMWHLSGAERSGGISGCTTVARSMNDYESAKRLARILYAYYEARGDAESAAHYNNLVTQWHYISQSIGKPEQILAEFENQYTGSQ